MATRNPTGFSADVRLWLRSGSQMIPLSHSSSTFVIAKTPIDLPAGDAEIIFSVDGEEYKRPVVLVTGMSTRRRETMVLSRDHLPF